MKKLEILAMLALSTMVIKASIPRTEEEKATYLQSKLNRGDKLETAEFRFALKLVEYKENLENGSITQEKFNKKMIAKVALYLSKPGNLGWTFVCQYMMLPLEELQNKVGTKETLGTMQRYITQKS